MNFFKKIFSKKEKKDEPQPVAQPIQRGTLDKDPNKVVEHVKGSGEKRNPIWIEKLTGPQTAKTNTNIEIIAEGFLPDLAWEIAETTYTIQGNELVVSVIGKRPIGVMAGQVVKPYQIGVQIKALPKGKYFIKPSKGNANELVLEVN